MQKLQWLVGMREGEVTKDLTKEKWLLLTRGPLPITLPVRLTGRASSTVMGRAKVE